MQATPKLAETPQPVAGKFPLIQRLRSELGDDSVLVGEAAALRLTKDWSGAPSELPVALLLPKATRDVATILRVCSGFSSPVVIQGGLTGLAGGANPQAGEIAISLSRLNQIEEFDEETGTIIVGAGVTLEELQNVASEKNWFFPLDLGARGSCQVGGNAATNAGGNRVLRYGMMRNAILGLEVVLPDGSILSRLDTVIKNNAGFDLKQIFIGSEGLLGVITRLSLKLEPHPTSKCTILCGVSSLTQAQRLLRECKRMLPELTAFELMWDDFFRASAKAIKRPLPFAAEFPIYVLIETLGANQAASVAAIEALLEEAIDKEIVDDAIVAQSLDQAKQLWDYREGISELLSIIKPCAAFDVSVAMPRMDLLVKQLRQTLSYRYPSRNHLFFGHLGDGNLHLMSGPYENHQDLEAVEELVYRFVGECGGSISAEHGIGVVKMPFLHHSRTQEELSVMRGLKRLFDPADILNRGRIF